MRIASLIGPELRALLHERPEEIATLAQELHPEDLADVLRDLSHEETGALLRVLPVLDAARVLERLDDHDQRDSLALMPRSAAVAIVAGMAPDRRAKLFRILSSATRRDIESVLRQTYPDAAASLDLIMRWPEASAGRLMTTSYVAVPFESTVGEALDAIRVLGFSSNEPVHAVYARDAAGRVLAFARLRELAPLPRPTALRDVWRRHIVSVSPTDTPSEVARVMSKYDLAALPVVDGKDCLLGLITIDDVIDVVAAETTREFERAGAVEPLDIPYFRTSFLSFIRKRGIWLIVLFVEEFFTQTALRHYDPVFEAIHGASYYVPLLISTGGNSGSQSATLVIRGMSVGEIQPRHWWRILVRESGMGLALGLLLGSIGTLRVLMYHDQHLDFAVTIGITLVGIVMVGCTVGSMLPLLLRRFGFDPATSSTPFIASLVDVLGIIVFVHVAKLVMAQVIAQAAATVH